MVWQFRGSEVDPKPLGTSFKRKKSTILKARLARLRLGSDIQEEAKHDRRLEDPVTTERKKFKKKTKKAAQDPYNEYTKNIGGKRKKKNKLTRSDQKRGKTERKKKKFKKTDIDIASGLARTESEGGFGKKTPSWENVPE